MKKSFAMLTAAILSLASLPVLAVGAESTFAQGDVDMDGVLTGHDTAVVSRYLLDDAYSLTDEQIALADANEDGSVDQADADWLSANEVYSLGDVDLDGEVTLEDGYILLQSYAKVAAGNEEYQISQVQLNLGNVTAIQKYGPLEDVFSVISLYSYKVACLFDDLPDGVYAVKDGANQYYFSIPKRVYSRA